MPTRPLPVTVPFIRPPRANGRWLLASVVACLALGTGGCGRETTANLPLDRALPTFSLTDQDGRAFTNADLKGKVSVAGFIFTTCPGPCLALTKQMQRIQRELGPNSGVQLLSFTVDPERDTPAALTQYAERLHVDPENWRFLTGQKDPMYKLIKEGFLQAVAENTGDKSEAEGDFIHSTRLVLVDANGHFRAYYEGLEDAGVLKAIADARALAKAGS